MQNGPRLIQKFSTIPLFDLICLCKKIKVAKGSVHMSFRTRRWHVPSRNHEPSWEKLRFARSLYQSLSQFNLKNYRNMLVPVMKPCQVSWFSGVFWIYKNFKTKLLNVLGRKDWETWFFNSCKSKTHVKIMKLGMVSWDGTNMLR